MRSPFQSFTLCRIATEAREYHSIKLLCPRRLGPTHLFLKTVRNSKGFGPIRGGFAANHVDTFFTTYETSQKLDILAWHFTSASFYFAFPITAPFGPTSGHLRDALAMNHSGSVSPRPFSRADLG